MSTNRPNTPAAPPAVPPAGVVPVDEAGVPLCPYCPDHLCECDRAAELVRLLAEHDALDLPPIHIRRYSRRSI